MFKKCLHEFINRWNGKHPLPWDMFNTFNDVSGKNLNWFFHSWFFTNGYIDTALANVSPNENGYSVSIKNLGGFVAPVNVLVTYDDNSKAKFHQTPEIWSKDQKLATINIATKKKIKSMRLDGDIYMDFDETNNIWQQK